MPGCVLRVGSSTADVEDLIVACGLTPIVVCRKGLPRTPGSSKLIRESGFNVDVSLADGDLEKQTRDAVRFLRRHAAGLSHLRGHQRCSSMVLDFGLHDQATDARPWPSYHLPATLIELAGRLGIAIELSFYGRT